MAGGWAKDGAVQDQIDDRITVTVYLTFHQLPLSLSAISNYGNSHCNFTLLKFKLSY
jgi:hypothetical protein